MSENNFYVTTPIYYVNDKPHIGHAYTTILGDILTRYNRIAGRNSFFLTGTDEHGQKVEKAAEEHGMTPQQQCDTTVIRFKELWDKLEITNDQFIRTTDDYHKDVVQKVLQDLFDRDLIYKAEYNGRYCVPCERFYTDKDLDEDDSCPECKRETQEIVESNYFFRMSNYQEWLIDYIKTNPDFIQPSFRANETLGFLQQPLNDLCISRPKSRLSWGIELPFDEEYVCYVWFDALINYLTGAGYGHDEEEFKKWWPASYHLIGKDILTTHTVYWPTMLKAIGLEMPKTIFAHGWWLIGRDKMSKSVGNVINPMDMVEKYGVDAFRYFLMAEMSLGQDASFTEEAFVTRFNSNLANDLGNLLSRVAKMTLKQFDGVVPEPSSMTEVEIEFLEEVKSSVPAMLNSIKEMHIERGIEKVMQAVRCGNRYMEQTAPWTLAKNGDMKRLGTVIYTAAEALRIISALLYPLMPEKMKELRCTLGMSENDSEIIDFDTLLDDESKLKPGSKMNDIGALFLRLKVEKTQPQVKKQEKKQKGKGTQKEKVDAVGVVTFDEFFKTQLKTAKVIEAEKVEGADKLLKLQVEVGDEKRQIVAGIAEFYSPDEILGKIVVIVANLKPAKIRGVESQGMLLAAKSGKKLTIITVDGEVPSGISVG